MKNIINVNTMNIKQYGYEDDDVYMKSHYESDTEDESESNTGDKSTSDV